MTEREQIGDVQEVELTADEVDGMFGAEPGGELPRNCYIELISRIGQRHVPHTEDVLERGDHVTFIGEVNKPPVYPAERLPLSLYPSLSGTMNEQHQRRADDVTRRKYLQLTAVGGTALALGTRRGAATEHHINYDVTIRSTNSPHPVDIQATVYRPAGASASEPVPMILHSHGWGGTRTSSDGAFQAELDAGFGVLSFTQRGHGNSGGKAHVQEPDREGQDVIAVLDYVEELEWVQRTHPNEGNDSNGRADDPMVFAMGGSYGGAYQLVGAFTELRERGYTRFDALAPQITWYDLSESLAPERVPRTTWVLALYATGAQMLPQYVHEGFAYSVATGEWPDGEPSGEPDLDSTFHDNGSVGFVEDGFQLDVPVLFGQGLSDNLFNLNQVWKNFERAFTPRARQRSAVVGYNGGHALPNVLPLGDTSFRGVVSGPPEYAQFRLEFFEHVRDGTGDARTVVGSPYLLTTAAGDRRVAVDALDDRTAFGGVDLSVYGDGDGGLSVANTDTVASTTGVGAPVHLPLADGPLTVAGVPDLSATVTTLGVNQRLFAGLSVGQSPATAQVVQNNLLPLNVPEPLTREGQTIELPGVAVDVDAGEQLYLTLTAASDMYVGHGSTRSPGTVVLEDLSVGVPLTEN
jgi:ABC-2 type transport system ATP-binding protein